ncbi:helix-turn-helix domain-containing protein [Lactobacillus kitasatonis]|uniref:Helix-turn-helix domain-containing protein n=1 Tax=Lactobacillus kitasatonis DSM 16761 = JCM 1039 TaxID=1423767 RepID=A0A0R1VE81_9LACO|nr:helix-turn-helix domain-containing protein [Lactobacillus kitasatonis]KRM03838.1 hypothetical protein FC59_GL001010 [Lactobacillus kitasatonis DSM 16761 = JCM 1039]
MSIKLNLNKSMDTLNPSYLFNQWTKYVKNNKTGYFMLSNALETYLPFIKSAAMNLYIFYAIHAKNEEGCSYYSNETIARKLNVSVKTISNWNKVLQDVGLIARTPNPNNSSTTYMLPLSDFEINVSSASDQDFKRLSSYLNQEGYGSKKYILFYIADTQKMYKYFPFTKEYVLSEGKISRNIYLYNEPKQYLTSINTDIKGFGWYVDSENEFVLVWKPTNKSENNPKNRLEIIKQLDSQEAIESFQANYPKLSLSKK